MKKLKKKKIRERERERSLKFQERMVRFVCFERNREEYYYITPTGEEINCW